MQVHYHPVDGSREELKALLIRDWQLNSAIMQTTFQILGYRQWGAYAGYISRDLTVTIKVNLANEEVSRPKDRADTDVCSCSTVL